MTLCEDTDACEQLAKIAAQLRVSNERAAQTNRLLAQIVGIMAIYSFQTDKAGLETDKEYDECDKARMQAQCALKWKPNEEA